MSSCHNKCNKANIGQYIKTTMMQQRTTYCARLIITIW